jgi:starvation-inducible DNA-binding protein
MAPDVAETTLIPRPPKGREETPAQISRLLHAHEVVIKEARAMARNAAEMGDERSDRQRGHSAQRVQVWFVAEHVVDVRLTKAV